MEENVIIERVRH